MAQWVLLAWGRGVSPTKLAQATWHSWAGPLWRSDILHVSLVASYGCYLGLFGYFAVGSAGCMCAV